MRRLLPALMLLALLGMPGRVIAGVCPYFSSAECDGTNPNDLYCDDFERGVWYTIDHRLGGTCPTSGNQNPEPSECGWCGNNGGGQINNPTAASGKGYGGTTFAARMLHQGTSGTNMGTHNLVNFVGVTEMYARWYLYHDPGFVWGQHKHITINNGNPGDGGIDFGNIQFNCGGGSQVSSVDPTWQMLGNTSLGEQNACLPQNLGNNISIVPGRYYFFELHLRVNTSGQANGVVDLWVNDCGALGVNNCGALPIKRMAYTNIKFPSAAIGDGTITTFYIDEWVGAPGSNGTNYVDQIRVSRTGPIGFFGGGGPAPTPGPPTAPKLCRGTNCPPQ